MPGPGGGAHGGGGHGGGGFGGGHGGGGHGGGFGGGHGGGPRPGGFGGGPHGPHGWGPRPPRGPHWGRGPRRYGGGGCLGFLLAPIIIIFVMIFFVMMIFGSVFKVERSDVMEVVYNENTYQDYAYDIYETEFGSSSAYEDNILLSVLTNEECNEYYYIAFVGDHIAKDVNYLFGNEMTELGRAMSSAINTASYKYSLDTNLADVVSQMSDEITSLGLDSSFTCNEEHNSVSSHITNKTSLPLTNATVNDALEKFTNETGISLVIVVDDMATVFGSTPNGVSYSFTIWQFLLILVIVAVIVYFIVRYVRKRKEDDYYNGTN